MDPDKDRYFPARRFLASHFFAKRLECMVGYGSIYAFHIMGDKLLLNTESKF